MSWLGQTEAALLAAGGDSVASHRTAARLHGFDRVPRWRPEVATTSLDLPRHPGFVYHRTNLLEPIDRCLACGLPTTAPARTLLDLGGVTAYEVVEHAVEDAVIRKLVTHGQLFAVLERVGGRGRRGTAKLRAVLRAGLPDERVASILEHKLHQLIGTLPVEPPEIQFPFRCVDGRDVRFDFAWPARKVAVEPDGHRWHGTSQQLRKDLARRRSVQASGWSLYSYGWADATEQATLTRAELCRVLVA